MITQFAIAAALPIFLVDNSAFFKLRTKIFIFALAACAFGFLIHFVGQGGAAVHDFYYLYFLEMLLSVDNVFVLMMIFGSLKMGAFLEKKAFFIGIVIAIGVRMLMIKFCLEVSDLHFLNYIFGTILLYSGLRTVKGFFLKKPEKEGLMTRFIAFMSRKSDVNKKMANFIVAIFLIAMADITFAIDSIPVSTSVTKNIDVIMSANIFAVLCMRTIVEVLKKVHNKIHSLELGIGLTLVFIGFKIFVSNHFHIAQSVSLLFTCGVIFGVIAKDLLTAKKPSI